MRQANRENTGDSARSCAALDRWLLAHPEARTLTVYSALPGEVDPSVTVLRHPDRRWAYPRISGDCLTLHLVTDPASQLLPGPYGILEPDPRCATLETSEIDAFICPGLAFDRHGGRLGRGRGFYDRMLGSARPGSLKIGLCFPHQVVPNTFSEPHDIPMDEVLY